MFLPPVIVIKSSELESGISRLKHEKLDEVDIAKFWKAFASVRQHTVGSFALTYRLENFWWRVWSSKQKHLSGLELGRLCSHLYNERFNLSLRRQLDFIGETSSQANTTCYAGGDYYEDRCATEIDSKISLEYNPQPDLEKLIRLPSQCSRSDAQSISPNTTEDNNSKAHSVPCIVLSPASLNSCETKTERKRIFGPSISKKRNKVLNKNRKPLVARRFGSHLSTDSVRVTDGSIHRRIVKPLSKSDGVSAMNEKSNYKLLENNSKALFAEIGNTSAMPKLKSPDHKNYKIDSKKPETMSCIEKSKEVDFGDKMIKAGVNSIVYGLQDEVSSLGTDELPVQEKMNCTLLKNYLKQGRSSSNTTLKNLHNNSNHYSAIPDNIVLNENMKLQRNKSRNLDSSGQAQSRGNLITSKTTTSDKTYNTSLKSPVLTYCTRSELSNEREPRTIGSQMPLSIFAKRSIQPTFSLSESTDKLSISESQLTLLIKKDRAKFEESGLPTGK